jgi:hypothetical protein
MAQRTPSRQSRTSLSKDADAHVIEDAVADPYVDLYPLLAGSSKDELDKLNKSVLRKLDWKFLPCITAMLLMKWDLAFPFSRLRRNMDE